MGKIDESFLAPKTPEGESGESSEDLVKPQQESKIKPISKGEKNRRAARDSATIEIVRARIAGAGKESKTGEEVLANVKKGVLLDRAMQPVKERSGTIQGDRPAQMPGVEPPPIPQKVSAALLKELENIADETKIEEAKVRRGIYSKPKIVPPPIPEAGPLDFLQEELEVEKAVLADKTKKAQESSKNRIKQAKSAEKAFAKALKKAGRSFEAIESVKKEMLALGQEQVEALALVSVEQRKKSLRESLDAIDNKKKDNSEMGYSLRLLEMRDPQGFEMIRNSDIQKLVDTEVFNGVLRGDKLEYVTTDGESVVNYKGKQIGVGSGGEVFFVGHTSDEGKTASFDALKVSLPGMEDMFREEIQSQMFVSSLGSDAIIASKNFAEDGRAYQMETSLNARDLEGSWGIESNEYINSLDDVAKGLMVYHENGMFHGDLKDVNVLRLEQDAGDEGEASFKTVLIDNNPVAFESILGTRDVRYENENGEEKEMEWYRFSTSPGWAYEPSMIREAADRLEKSNVSMEVITAQLARAHDTYSFSVMAKDFLEGYFSKMDDQHPAITLVNKIQGNPIFSGDPGTLQALAKELNKLKVDQA